MYRKLHQVYELKRKGLNKSGISVCVKVKKAIELAISMVRRLIVIFCIQLEQNRKNKVRIQENIDIVVAESASH